MYTYERDFRYLLLNLLPRHRLDPGLRRDVDRALRAGDVSSLRRQSVRALESLRESEWLERNALLRDGDHVRATYHRPGGGYRLTVTVPAAEWSGPAGDAPADNASGDPPDLTTAEGHSGRSSREVTTEPGALPGTEKKVDDPNVRRAVAGPPSPGAPGGPDRSPAQTPEPVSMAGSTGDATFLPDVLRSFTVGDRGESLLGRVEALLRTLEKWFGIERAELDVVEDTPGAPPEGGSRILRVDTGALRQDPLFRQAIETGAHRLVPRKDASWDGGPAGAWGTLGVAAVFSLGRVQGVLRLFFPEGVDEPTMAGRLNASTSLVRQVFELHNQVANLTSVDALTGVYNRHFFDTQLAVETERAMRSGTPVSLLMLDIDDFKRVNDELGHRKGDEALCLVAELIRRHLRKVDMPFRYGGEEFVILLPGTPELEAVHTAERLRRVISEHTGFLDLHGQPRRITVSVGVSVYPDLAKTADSLFEQSDRAMYRAKSLGKNRVIRFDDATPSEDSDTNI